ncbi:MULTISPECIES: iron-siderophore ABC transporter substrate-binding protein [Mycobacterium avium complex (MAC)]|uniref:Fe3+-citrate ABC transporter substrate-binding protein n=1 Tax=Mycobacterium bouchedurhonense TaxID=701041 RepID=A0AAW5S0U3_MYCBC|nr:MULTISPECIES: iron-siderophore ABC transporter substrate-binding protein [Mycobacterium avium complex (MAC)]ETA94809.1 Fe3+-citrate ABC transporter substrate-binding protein [Mycobacterium avium 05-4293]ETZ50394.1 periplasmic binding family protein [Mycobacterium avium MAV_061107_1842]KDO94309.1 Fe3+-citrate ABC transporter substrate-binding protein [Mycobacterium avium subsp. hominissuis A5]MBZ4534579.1 iron-siderophore ABC transporter substrate-binding protein [Mycobacterium avium subsp. h
MLFGVIRPARLAAVTAALVVACGGCGSDRPAATTTRSLVTPTTQIAGAGVLGNDRRPDESCARDAAEADPGPAKRQVHNAPGGDPAPVQVSADPQRIVVLAGDQLDALCALGLQSRVVGAALPDGASGQPAYLGGAVRGVPGVGSRSHPDVKAIAAAHPDLILGSQGLTPALYPQLAAIAPTVFTAAPGAAWRDNLRAVGAATARAGAVDGLLSGFSQRAGDVGARHDASHFQASIVQLTTGSIRVFGANNFPASVLGAVGVDRPAAQRFTDKPYLEIGATDADLAKNPDLSVADADVVYLSCATPAAADRAATVLDSGPWRKLSANRDNRVYVVNDEIWQTGQGLIAARGIVDDLRLVNAPIN